ncbi:MAG: DNA polymerase III subunit gamma/tau [Candidatus Kerfeldbacteria bacterium]|nr:DNA polymerase III subunit gamma/tau [Candidatus Kerfeldbacteria bacterium]
MTQTLYRKYRPQAFGEVVGQDHIKVTLENEIKLGRLTHAYLFCGMRGVGKTTMARLLAKAVNCESRKPGEAEPCNKCVTCQAINEGRSFDLIEIDAASNRRIDDIRELRDNIPHGPARSHYKVVIIDEVHMLTAEAFNALLKTLEEPPAHVIFVLATTEVHKLPETIVSRCQRFDFRRLTPADLVRRLITLSQAEGVKVEQSVLEEIARLAGGSSRDAESYLGKLLSLGEKKITTAQAHLVLPHSDVKVALSFVRHLILRQAGEAVALLNNFLDEGGELGYFYKQVLELMRQLLLIKLGGQLGSQDKAKEGDEVFASLTELSGELTQGRLQSMLETWLALEKTWQQSEVYQLPLELGAVAICQEGFAVVPGSTGSNNDQAVGRTSQAKESHSRLSVAASRASPTPLVNLASSQVSLEEIAKRWPEVVAKLRDFNHSLSFILSIAKPTKLEGNTLTIGFQYKLHQERVQDPKVRQVVEQALAQILSVEMSIHGVLEEGSDHNRGDFLSSVLSTFSGRLLE